MDDETDRNRSLPEDTAEYAPLPFDDRAALQTQGASDSDELETGSGRRSGGVRRFRIAARTPVIRRRGPAASAHGGDEGTGLAATRGGDETASRSGRRNWWRRTLLLSFFFPILILGIAYVIQGFWPVADTSPLTVDLYHQYASFISEVRHKLMAGESFLYSWRGGLGNNFFAIFAYYAASPLNLLLLAFPTRFITEAITVLTLLKVGLIGLNMAVMLRYVYCPEGRRTIASRKAVRVRHRREVGTDWLIVGFSVAFALSGFVLTYSWDIMWLDGIVLLPLIVLGLHRMIHQNKFLLYTVTLALAILINYYIAFFIAVFLVFYFFVAYFTYTSRRLTPLRHPFLHFLKKLAFFGGFSLLAAGMSAVMTLPTILTLQHTSAAGDTWPEAFELRFTLFEFLTRHLLSAEPAIRSGLPNIRVGLLMMPLLVLYLFTRGIRLREKAGHLLLLAFLYISFNSKFLDFFWHGMHYPNQLPYRYSFLYSFLLIIIGFRAITYLREFSLRMILAATGLGIVFVILAEQITADDVTPVMIYGSLAFFLAYMAVFALLRRRGNFRRMATLLLIVMLTETAVNTTLVIHQIGKNEHYTSRDNFVRDIPQVQAMVDDIREADPGFYRMELMPQKTSNDGPLYDYPGFSTFSSTNRESVAKLMRKLGYHGNNINSYRYISSTPVTDSLFGLRYRIMKQDPLDDPHYEEIMRDGDMRTYRLSTAYAPGYITRNGLDLWRASARSAFAVQNSLTDRAFGISDLYRYQELSVGETVNVHEGGGSAKEGYSIRPDDKDKDLEVTLSMTMPQSGSLYFHVDTKKKLKTEVVRIRENPSGPTEESVTSRTMKRPEIIEAGYYEAGETVHLKASATTPDVAEWRVSAAVLDDAAYRRFDDALAERQIHIEAYDTRSLRGTLTTVDGDRRVLLAIPYDEGWSLRLNGKPHEVGAVAEDSLLSFLVEPGTHHFELVYTPPGFRVGAYLSAISLVIFLILILIKRYIVVRRRAREVEEPEPTPPDEGQEPARAAYDEGDDTRLATAEDLEELREVRAGDDASADAADQATGNSADSHDMHFMRLSSDEGDGYMEVRRFDALGHDADPATFDVFEDETEAEVKAIVSKVVKRSDRREGRGARRDFPEEDAADTPDDRPDEPAETDEDAEPQTASGHDTPTQNDDTGDDTDDAE